MEYRRLRRRARFATLAFVLVAAQLAYLTARAAGESDPRPAILPFLALCALTATAFWVLRSMWLRSFAARPAVLPVDPGPGALRGLPELDEPSGRHIGLNGEVEPPRRW